MKKHLTKHLKKFVSCLLILGILFSNSSFSNLTNFTVQAASSDIYIYVHEGEQTTVYNYTHAYSALTVPTNTSIATADVSPQSGTAQPASAPNQTISLTDCLYTLQPGSGNGTYQLAATANGTTV